MHPTPEEQLDAILRLVEGAASDSAIAEDSNAMLTDASRLIRRLQRSWSGRLPFLSHDNALAAELLTHLAPMLPSLQHEIDDVVRSVEQSRADEPATHETNKRFQGLLARAVHQLPGDNAGDEGRARIVTHLRNRLAADPALNRAPADRAITN